MSDGEENVSSEGNSSISRSYFLESSEIEDIDKDDDEEEAEGRENEGMHLHQTIRLQHMGIKNIGKTDTLLVLMKSMIGTKIIK